jgi:hypothetical protein
MAATEDSPQNALEFDPDGLMKKQNFTEGHIIAVLTGRETGAKAADLRLKYGISEATF